MGLPGLEVRALTDPAVQDRLEALCCYEALDLFRKAGVRGTSRRLIAAVAALHEGED